MSGEGEEYTDDDVNDLYDAIDEAWGDRDGKGDTNGSMTVEAKIEWAGEYANNGHGGTRSVNLAGVNTVPVVAALKQARKLEERALRGPLRSYDAKSANAQFRQLERTPAGRAALIAAGVSATARTQLAWITGDRTPTRANQERIREAYDNARNPGRGVMDARRAVADALTQSIKDLPGDSTVRFRDIESFEID